uniref:Uncharacterized protein n=1 Tax=Knipowitschia caucasica TaxID=637954 RepID=A0AAV2L4Y5_KNICA
MMYQQCFTSLNPRSRKDVCDTEPGGRAARRRQKVRKQMDTERSSSVCEEAQRSEVRGLHLDGPDAEDWRDSDLAPLDQTGSSIVHF